MQLAFKVVRSNGHDEIIALADNLFVGRAAYREACKLYPKDLIELRHRARIIQTTKPRE